MCRNKNIYVTICFIFTLLLSSFFSCSTVVAEEELLTPEQMKENMEFIRDRILENHPNPYNSISKYEYKMLYRELLSRMQEPMSPVEFSFIARRFLMPLRDAHTTMGYDFTKYEDLNLPLILVWLPDGVGVFMAKGEYERLEHARVLEIEGVPIDVWIDRLADIVPHETIDWVRLNGNRIRSRNLMSFLTGQKNMTSASLKLEKDGRIFDVEVPFLPDVMQPNYVPESEAVEQESIVLDFPEELPAARIRVFHCLTSPEFYRKIDDFMDEVKKKKVKNLIIDMRDNPGGGSDYTWEFVKHFPQEELKSFTGIVTEMEKRKQAKNNLFKYDRSLKLDVLNAVTCPNTWKNPAEEENIKPFRGKAYVLVGRKTFSSGNYFPAVFQDNNLATIVGQRTGNSPCAYGNFESFTPPHGELWLNVSIKYFVRPSCLCDSNALVPDVEIPLTMDDVFQGRDPVMEWLEKHLKQEKQPH